MTLNLTFFFYIGTTFDPIKPLTLIRLLFFAILNKHLRFALWQTFYFWKRVGLLFPFDLTHFRFLQVCRAFHSIFGRRRKTRWRQTVKVEKR